MPNQAEDRPLTVPLLIRGSIDNSLLVGLFAIGGFFVAFAAFFWWTERPNDHFGSGFFLGLGCLFAAPALARAAWLWRHRRWLAVTLTGFVLTRRGQTTSIRDEQVVGVSQRGKFDSNNVLHRDVRIEIDDGTVRAVRCAYRVRPGRVDPLAALLDRVILSLGRRTHAGLPLGSTLAGKGWRLDAEGLHVGGEAHALKDLARSGTHDGHVCVWKGHDERPFLRVPVTTHNAGPLAVLLSEAIASNPARAGSLPGKPLGRILLDRPSTDWRAGLVLTGVFLPLCVPVVLAALFSDLENRAINASTCAILPALVLPLAALALFRAWGASLRFHEAGLSQVTRDGPRELAYADVGVLRWKGGAEIVCEPLPHLARPVIRYRARFHEDADMVAFRDHVAAVIAQRWWGELRAGPVRWMQGLSFRADGLEVRPGGRGDAGPWVVPYPATSYRVENGRLLLFAQGQSKPVLNEALGAPNIFPGLALLNRIYAGMRGPAADVSSRAPRLDVSARTFGAGISPPGQQSGGAAPSDATRPPREGEGRG